MQLEVGCANNDTWLSQSYSYSYSTSSSSLSPSTPVTPAIMVVTYPWCPWAGVLTVLVVLCTVLGNVLVCLAIIWERRLQNMTNYFLMSLAATDLLVAVLVMPFGILVVTVGHFPLSRVYCVTWVTLDVLLCTCSILHLATLSVDRFLSLRYPIRYGRHKTRRRVVLKICGVWLASAAVSVPLSLMYALDESREVIRDGTCAIQEPLFMAVGSVVCFYVPLLVMFVTHALTLRLLNSSEMVRMVTIGGASIRSPGPSFFIRPKFRSLRNSVRSVVVEEVAESDQQPPNSNCINENHKCKENDDTIGKYPFILPTSCVTCCRKLFAFPSCSSPARRVTGDNSDIASVVELKPLTAASTPSPHQYQTVAPPTFRPRKQSALASAVAAAALAASSAAGTTTTTVATFDGRRGSAGDTGDTSSEEVWMEVTIDAAGKSTSTICYRYEDADDLAEETVPTSACRKGLLMALETAVPTESPSIRSCTDDGMSPGMSSRNHLCQLPMPFQSREASVRRSATRHGRFIRSEKKASKVLGIVFFTFVALWSPFFTLNFVNGLCPSCTVNVSPTVSHLVLWLGYFSSTVNPVFYTIFNPIFRQTFTRILTCHCQRS